MPGAANATTLDFSDLTSGDCAIQGSAVVSQGFSFTAISGDNLFLCNPGVIANNTTPALIANNVPSDLGFAPQGGGTFSLQSFFAGSRAQNVSQIATGIHVIGTTNSGSVTQDFTFTGLDFSQFVLNSSFAALINIEIVALGLSSFPQFLITDIVVNEVVPLPAALPLYGTGLGLMALFGWWKRRRAAAA